jgi:hypothetical protein
MAQHAGCDQRSERPGRRRTNGGRPKKRRPQGAQARKAGRPFVKYNRLIRHGITLGVTELLQTTTVLMNPQ